MNNFIVFDTETTALMTSTELPDKLQPRIIEIAGIYFERNDEGEWVNTASINLLVNPEITISEKVTKITGITNEMVKEAPKLIDVYDVINSFFGKSTIAFAHNASFDRDILRVEMRRIGKENEFNFPFQYRCTVEETEHIEDKRMSLGKLHVHLFGFAFNEAHRAMNDVEALGRCIVECLKRGIIDED